MAYYELRRLNEFIRGDRFNHTVTANRATTPWTPAGVTVKVTIKTSEGGTEVYSSGPITPTVNGNQLTFSVDVAGSVTALWPTGLLYGDIEITDSTHGVRTPLKFVLPVAADITP